MQHNEKAAKIAEAMARYDADGSGGLELGEFRKVVREVKSFFQNQKKD